MKRSLLGVVALVALVALALTVTAAGEDQAWFDLDNCAICKNLSAEKGLIDNIQWESHLIASGMLSVAKVPAEYEEVYNRASKNMQASVMKMQQGEPAKLCGFCMSYGKLAMSGAKVEEVHSKVGHIGLVTSADENVVKMIHAHGQRTIDEYKKMQAEQASAGG